MSDLPAEIRAYLAIVLAGGTFFWSEHRYRKVRKASRAIGPGLDIRQSLEAVREDFDHIVSVGGETTRFFLEDVRRGSDQRLHDLSDRTEDAGLGTMLLEASVAWSNAWAIAPAPLGARMIDMNAIEETPAEKARQEEMEREVEVAREGRDRCQEALGRLNALEREIP
jgi:hypothetical protein